MAKTKDEPNNKATGSGNPSKNLKTITKAKNRGDAITRRMVIEALNHLDANLKPQDSGIGHSLAKIRLYLAKQHNLEMPKHRQEMVKQIMRTEHRNGAIVMTNSDGPLNFKMRFRSTVDDDDIDEDEIATLNVSDDNEP